MRHLSAPWIDFWTRILGLSPESPSGLVASIPLIGIFFLIVFPSTYFIAYFERKLGADLQARIGPHEAGPAGIFQGTADFLKLLQKHSPPGGQGRLKNDLLLGIYCAALYSTVAVLPLGSMTLLVDSDLNALVPFWIALVLAFLSLLMGLQQSSVQSWLAAMRLATQALSGVFPALITLLCAALRSKSLSWRVIMDAQAGSVLDWTVFSNPFEFIAFAVFMVSGLMLFNIPPMDTAIGRTDLGGGLSRHLYGWRLSLFRLSRYYAFFLWSTLCVGLFLGGWKVPLAISGLLKERGLDWLQEMLELVMILSKTFALMLCVIWISKSNPRLRVDQVTDLGWKILSPLALLTLGAVTIWVAWRGA